MSVRLISGDCREVMKRLGPFDLIIADPPYGDTALAWDRKVRGWEAVALERLKPTGSMWVFGSLRFLLAMGVPDGWRYAQDLVWEKHNGTGFGADRFKRVHEHVVQLVPKAAKWSAIYNDTPRIPRAGPSKTGATRRQLPHTGVIAPSVYEDDGTRIQRSVIKAPSVRGGPHKTAKPLSLVDLLVRCSCPPGGIVGDFFAGSGTVGEACVRAGRSYVGVEFDQRMAAVAHGRILRSTLEVAA